MRLDASAPRTEYATTADGLNIAYQVSGDGPVDLVIVPPIVSHLEAEWDIPPYRRFVERLGTRVRAIRFDKRGIGMSDRLADQSPSLDARMDDIRAVMDGAGADRAALLGVSEGGALAVLFATTYPQRVSALALFGSTARVLAADDYPPGVSREVVESITPAVIDDWGRGVSATAMAPSLAYNAATRAALGRVERMAATPRAFAAVWRLNLEFDIRAILATVSVPTIVMHRRDEIIPGVDHGRYLAAHIPGARFVEYPRS